MAYAFRYDVTKIFSRDSLSMVVRSCGTVEDGFGSVRLPSSDTDRGSGSSFVEHTGIYTRDTVQRYRSITFGAVRPVVATTSYSNYGWLIGTVSCRLESGHDDLMSLKWPKLWIVEIS